MTPREAFHAMMAGERPDMLCQFEPGYWPETIERWRNEGLPAHVEPWDDCGIIHYFRPEIAWGIYPPFPLEVLEEDTDTRVIRNESGIVCREYKHGRCLPQFISHPVKTHEDFLALKQRLDPTTPGRYPTDWEEWVASAKGSPHLWCIGRRDNGFFGWLRELMGLEGLLLGYMDQPDLIHEICRYHVTYLQGLYAKALREAPIDFVFMWEDMSYKNGPLISPAFFREFMMPYYRQMVDFYRQMGARWITVDSDGDISLLIPLFLEAGIDGLLPFEVAAGMDVRRVREQYPTLKILGGIDKRALARGKAAIDAELEAKLPFMFRAGRYLPSLDHHVPPDVSYENFKYYVYRCREIYAET
jgi:hypothetical protein